MLANSAADRWHADAGYDRAGFPAWHFFTQLLFFKAARLLDRTGADGLRPTMMLVVLVFSLVFGVAASIYLEEFAPKNKFTDSSRSTLPTLRRFPSIRLRLFSARRSCLLG